MTPCMPSVAHLTSVHSRDDIRIFVKECQSLARAGYDVALVVADGKGDDRSKGIQIYDVGKSRNRLDRMLRTTRLIYSKAKKLNAAAYHLHDPELIPIGNKLKQLGKIVIFDAHEDYPKQILNKPYLSSSILKILSHLYCIYERNVCRRFNCTVAATPSIKENFVASRAYSIVVNNFPIQTEFAQEAFWNKKPKEVCYVGGINKNRGLFELVQAIGLTNNGILNLAGSFESPIFAEELKNLPGWKSVNFSGLLDRRKVAELFYRSQAGVVALYPIPNYLSSLPIKMFEYMSAGLPVIASNFPLWQQIIKENKCGICVNPLDAQEIAQAIDWVFKHPEEAERMGKNGRKAVIEKYNWEQEETKLLQLYRNLIP